MSADLANWLGVAFLFGAGSFFAGWSVSNFYWRRWAKGQDFYRQSLVAEHLAGVNRNLDSQSGTAGALTGSYDTVAAAFAIRKRKEYP